MALIDSWEDKVNDEDVVDANDINSIAQDVINIEKINGIVQGDGEGHFSAASGSELLPEVTTADNDKVLKVVNGAWAAANGVTVTTSATSGTTGNTVTITT